MIAEKAHAQQTSPTPCQKGSGMNPINMTLAQTLLTIQISQDPDFSTRMLTISTAHVPLGTAAVLNAGDGVAYTGNFMDVDQGWMFSTSYTTMDERHPELCSLLKFAKLFGFQHLRLDADASKLPEALGFPVFDW